jgi:hypothetical protein
MVINTINGPGGVRPPNTIRRTAKTSAPEGTSFSRHLGETSDSDAAQAAQAAGALGQVTGVLSLQEVDDALARAAKGKLRAQDILDRLDDLRMELLSGTLTRDKLLRLAQIINNRKVEVTDPKLAELLAEVDLRAQVELAKYGPSHS